MSPEISQQFTINFLLLNIIRERERERELILVEIKTIQMIVTFDALHSIKEFTRIQVCFFFNFHQL